MFGKIENGRLVIAGRTIKRIDGGTTTCPTEEDLKENGYKVVEYDTKPEYNKEEEKLKEVYTDGENSS